jgi:hypothetical protein
MYLTTLDMTMLAARVRATEPKPSWDLVKGWPTSGVVWRVEPLPKHIGVMQQMGHSNVHFCHALTGHTPGGMDSPWSFVPGDAAGEIWLVKADAGTTDHVLS